MYTADMVRWLAWLLFGFRGRIPRKSYWLAQLIFILASLVGARIIAGPAFFSSVPSSGSVSPWLTAWNCILLFPTLAVAVKRFNDRGRPVWFAAIWLGTGLADLVAGQFGFFADPVHFGRLKWGLLAPYIILGLWLFIDLGFLRGQRGANRYGTDPLGTPNTAAVSQPARRTFGDNARDGITGLLLVIAAVALSDRSFSFPNLLYRFVDWLTMPQTLQTWEQRRANAPALKEHHEGGKAYNSGDFASAVRHYTREIALFGPQSRTAAWSYLSRADALEKMNQMQAALSDYDKAIALEPDDFLGYNARADLFIKLGRYNDALRDFAASLAQEPDQANTLVARGNLLEKMGHYREAEADFAQAIATAHNKYDKRIAREKKAAKLWTRVRNKILVKAYTSRGRLYEKQGQRNLARADYEKAASFGPPSDALKRALERTR